MDRLIYKEEKPVVTTKYGKVRGVSYGGVNLFLGIKYADAERFRMPEDPECWEGIKDANNFGYQCMQMRPAGPAAFEQGFGNEVPESEDCQYLNVWASDKPSDGPKPVFVWMHGGGFFSGNAVENRFYEGFNMAKRGDLVFVSLNHRLNLIGHLNLTNLGEEFADAKNLGLFDLVAALKWVHENITAFGGDPDNVTICGHSGGGGKVLAMYQMEAAKDYFQRGIVMSGCLDNGPETNEEDSRYMADCMLEVMGIGRDNKEKIFEVTYADILAAYQKTVKKMAAENRNFGISPVPGNCFRGFPIDVGFEEWSKEKPLLISTTLGEFNFKVNIPDEVKESLTEEKLAGMLKDRFGEGWEELAELFKKAYPSHSLIDLMYLDTDFRRPSYATAVTKAETGCENTYMHLFAYNMPINCRITPWHGADIPYAFANADKVPVCNEEIWGEKMEDILFSVFTSFARTGKPEAEGLPEWLPFTKNHRRTMVIDRQCELKEAYDEDLVKLCKKLCPPLDFHPETN